MKPNRSFSIGIYSFLLLLFSLFLGGCQKHEPIVNNVDEREANEIIVFLGSKGIEAKKLKATESAVGGAPSNLWNITVEEKQTSSAMSILNQNGLPRRRGATLLELFAKQGLMTSEKEENIRYQAGQEEELKNIIRKIDGVLDADVRISFPSTEGILPGAAKPKIKAAVYIKHQGVLDDPNNHLESKIKRLVAGSVERLDFEDVSVISDRSRFSDIQLKGKTLGQKRDDYVSIWSIVMTKASSSRFRFFFTLLLSLILLFGFIAGWLIYKFYPYMQKETLEKKENEENKF
jgi:type III secretion protein J